ncbi:MAG TPA: hypothetical protein VHY08_02425, partial [Bacillota bacterium]|nr:hypothetical protein [Bacillota bacterium]
AVLYPITYISLFMSKLLFGHYFAGMDIQAIFHLIFGGLGLFFLLKELSLDDKSALFGALAYPLCSFNVILSNSWIVVGGPIGYFPWMIYLGIKFIRAGAQQTFSRKYYILLILARLMVAFYGHTQYFIYSVLLEILTVTWFIFMFRQGKSVKQILRPFVYYILSLGLTAILSLPLHLPMWKEMNISFSRSGAFDLAGLMEEGILLSDWIQGLTWPFAFSSDPFAGSHDLVFIGFITLIFIAEALIAILTIFIFRTREKTAPDPAPKKVALSAVVLLGLAVICFSWACNIIVPYIIQYIPILNRFRWPFKLQLFLSFYLIAASACGFYLFFKKLRPKKLTESILVVSLILIQLFTFYQLYINSPLKSRRSYADPVPMAEPLKNQLKDGRIISVGFYFYDPYAIHAIGYNYATLWGLYQFGGYDPFKPLANMEASLGLDFAAYYPENLNEQPERVEYLRSWGVKWYVVDPGYIDQYGGLKFARVIDHDAKRTVYLDDQALPLFYWNSDQSGAGIHSQITTNSIRLLVYRDREDELLINFMYNPFFKATLDGKKLKIFKADGRIRVNVPRGNHVVNLRYIDPYFNIGCYLAIICIIGMGAVFYLYPRLRKK